MASSLFTCLAASARQHVSHEPRVPPYCFFPPMPADADMHAYVWLRRRTRTRTHAVHADTRAPCCLPASSCMITQEMTRTHTRT
ncbi:hypothetical protein EON67_12070 [archaeon]|nr:MAG: hypothetical protein EON67_12070 [archaeon]